ncbi:MAG: phospholipase D-like domain-containing protein [Chloroflexota bacterium]|nr:phospholipase D-like domain-containing protein [Chloroflexota bacterium]MDE2947117.1 phospholipase D-like domain-containing protein [Chloroflexota bacterium]
MESNRGAWRKAGRWFKTLVAGCFPLILLAALLLHGLARPRHKTLTLPQGRSETPTAFREAHFQFGRGYIGDGWRVYFNEPDAAAEQERYTGGIEMALADAINAARVSLDIAAFELNSEALTQAILDAQGRGLAVRIVTDDEHGLHDDKNDALRRLQAAGVPVVDDGRSGLMHNKFLIVDGQTVWTGSMNFTVNGSYRNNNNLFVMESAAAAETYQAEFDEMFQGAEFGVTSTDDGVNTFTVSGGEASIIFAPEAEEISALKAEIEAAARSIRIMTFVFSLEELAEAILMQAARHGVSVEGVFEKRNSTASWSQLPALHCAGAAMRQDGSRYTLHHKVIIIDDHTVITGSFNYSRSAAERNDENIVIIRDETVAGLYLAEWRRIWNSAQPLAPGAVDCA